MGMQDHRYKVVFEKEAKCRHKKYRTWYWIYTKRKRLKKYGFKNTRSSRPRLFFKVTNEMNTIRMMKRWGCKSIVEFHKILYGENHRKRSHI